MGKKKERDLSPEIVEIKSDEIENLEDWVGDDDHEEQSSPNEIEKERDELLDQLLRKQAEFENFRKRMNREKTEARLTGQEQVLREVLGILDACERGLQSFDQAEGDEDPKLQAYREGYELFMKSLENLLTRFDVTAVPGPGEPFDPTYHEAVLREENPDFEDGQVIDEFRRGYLFQGRLLRPSQVRVAVHPKETPSS